MRVDRCMHYMQCIFNGALLPGENMFDEGGFSAHIRKWCSYFTISVLGFLCEKVLVCSINQFLIRVRLIFSFKE